MPRPRASILFAIGCVLCLGLLAVTYHADLMTNRMALSVARTELNQPTSVSLPTCTQKQSATTTDSNTPETPHQHYLAGWRAWQAGDCAEAQALWSALKEQSNPHELAAIHLTWLDQNLSETMTSYVRQSADLLFEQDEGAAGVEWMRFAFEADPSVANAQLLSEAVYLHVGLIEDAVNWQIISETYPPTTAIHWLGKGRNRLTVSEFAEAAEYLSNSVERAGDEADLVWPELIDTLLKLDDCEQAIAEGREMVAFRPNSADSNYTLGNTLLECSQFEEASDYLLQANQLNADDFDIALATAEALYEIGQYESAAPLFAKAHDIRPRRARPLAGAALTQDKLGDQAAAIQLMEQAIDQALVPRVQWIVELGQWYTEADDISQAIGVYQYGLSSHPDSEVLLSALEAIEE